MVSTHFDCLAALFVATLFSRSGLWLLSVQSAAEILGFLNNGGCGPGSEAAAAPCDGSLIHQIIPCFADLIPCYVEKIPCSVA